MLPGLLTLQLALLMPAHAEKIAFPGLEEDLLLTKREELNMYQDRKITWLKTSSDHLNIPEQDQQMLKTIDFLVKEYLFNQTKSQLDKGFNLTMGDRAYKTIEGTLPKSTEECRKIGGTPLNIKDRDSLELAGKILKEKPPSKRNLWQTMISFPLIPYAFFTNGMKVPTLINNLPVSKSITSITQCPIFDLITKKFTDKDCSSRSFTVCLNNQDSKNKRIAGALLSKITALTKEFQKHAKRIKALTLTLPQIDAPPAASSITIDSLFNPFLNPENPAPDTMPRNPSRGLELINKLVNLLQTNFNTARRNLRNINSHSVPVKAWIQRALNLLPSENLAFISSPFFSKNLNLSFKVKTQNLLRNVTKYSARPIISEGRVKIVSETVLVDHTTKSCWNFEPNPDSETISDLRIDHCCKETLFGNSTTTCKTRPPTNDDNFVLVKPNLVLFTVTSPTRVRSSCPYWEGVASLGSYIVKRLLNKNCSSTIGHQEIKGGIQVINTDGKRWEFTSSSDPNQNDASWLITLLTSTAGLAIASTLTAIGMYLHKRSKDRESPNMTNTSKKETGPTNQPETVILKPILKHTRSLTKITDTESDSDSDSYDSY